MTSLDGLLGTLRLLDARASVLALREGADNLGAELAFGQRGHFSRTRPGKHPPVKLRVGNEDVAADMVLICAGAWSVKLPEWARMPGARVEPAHMQLATFSDIPPSLGDQACYLIAHGDEPFCAIPLGTGDQLQFGHFSAPAGARKLSPSELVHATRLRDLAALRRLLPGLGPARDHSSLRDYYTMPRDDGFVLRWVASRIATLVACSGVGFKFAPAIARRVVGAFGGDSAPGDGIRVEGWT